MVGCLCLRVHVCVPSYSHKISVLAENPHFTSLTCALPLFDLYITQNVLLSSNNMEFLTALSNPLCKMESQTFSFQAVVTLQDLFTLPRCLIRREFVHYVNKEFLWVLRQPIAEFPLTCFMCNGISIKQFMHWHAVVFSDILTKHYFAKLKWEHIFAI